MKPVFRSVLCLFALLFESEAVLNERAQANQAFGIVLDPADFGFTSSDDTEVDYVIEMSPQDTDWVRFAQKRLVFEDGSLSPGVVYGTPRDVDAATTARLHITAYSSTSFQSASEEMEIYIEAGEGPAVVFLFQLTEMTIFKFLQNPLNKDNFASDVSKIWTTSSGEHVNVKVYQYFTYEEKGTRMSSPAPGQLPREGMYIVAGPVEDASSSINTTSIDCLGTQQEHSLPNDYASIAVPFSINWCSFTPFVIGPQREKIIQVAPPRESGYKPDVSRPSDFDQLDIFLKTVVALLAVAVVLFLVLAYVMCCRRKKTRDFDTQASGDAIDGSEIIVNKRAIQGASTKLRRIPVQPNWDAFVSKGMANRVVGQSPDRKVLLHSDDEVDRGSSYRKSGLFSSDDDELAPKKELPSYRGTPRYSSAESTLEKKPPLDGSRPPPAYVKPPIFGSGGTVSPSMVDPRVSPTQGTPPYIKPLTFGERIIESEPQDV